MQAPSNQNRIVVVGRTGSGKTQFAMWLLGELYNGAWSDMPVTIFDFKRAKLIGAVAKAGGARVIDINKKPPKSPGLYVVRPAPVEDDQAVLDYLRHIYENTDHALYFDEAYELGNRNRGFRRLLTQGRELEIPMMYCTQRPVNCDLYSLSEADYWALFHLRNPDDIQRVRDYAPDYNPNNLGKYQCHWYDVASDQGVDLKPAPGVPSILSLFSGRPLTGEQINQNPEAVRRRSML